MSKKRFNAQINRSTSLTRRWVYYIPRTVLTVAQAYTGQEDRYHCVQGVPEKNCAESAM